MLAHLMGPMGTSVGFAVTTAGSLLVANLMGLWLGEWREAPPAAGSGPGCSRWSSP